MPKRIEGQKWRWTSVLLCSLMLMLALLPAGNIAYIIATVGTDNVSNDYLTYAHLIDSILSGKYDMANLVRDTFYRGHATTLPFLCHLASAQWFQASVMPELWLGFGLALGRLIFWFDSLRLSSNNKQPLILLVFLSFLIFSNSQISLFTYSGATLPIGASLFGQALAIWGLARFGSSAPGVLIALAGGLVSSYSWGNGPISWLLILVYYFCLGRPKPGHCLLLFSAAALSAIPYVMSLVASGDSTGAINPEKALVSFFNLRVIVELLGWAFANEIATHTDHLPEARQAGIAGLILASSLLPLILLRYGRSAQKNAIVPLILLASGLLGVYQVSLVRSLLAPWYATIAIPFWASLLSMATFFLVDTAKDMTDKALIAKFCTAWGVICLFTVSTLYARANLTYEDKTNLLYARAPVSISALLHAETAPTYADQYVFLWTPGSPSLLQKLADVLKRHQLNPLAKQKTVWLQGDFLFDSVRIDGAIDAKSPYFTDDSKSLKKTHWYHYKKLDLVIPSGNIIKWTVDIPMNTQSCRLRSAILDEAFDSRFTISILPDAPFVLSSEADKHKQEIDLDLGAKKGTKAIIWLDNSRTPYSASATVLQQPRIVLTLKNVDNISCNWRPENTELKAYAGAIKHAKLLLDIKDIKSWKSDNGEARISPRNNLHCQAIDLVATKSPCIFE
ncbi:MAG: hypothetical protein K8F91_24885, partial [Candidatus Obscuribacterales bacterium]|nr:hypothetical protein [Candidatus Obscuribacterales bacterium]